MFGKFFYSIPRVIFLVLFLVCFFDFSYLPHIISLRPDRKLLAVIMILLLLGFAESRISIHKNKFRRCINTLFVSLFLFSIVNCISCYFYRHQQPWVTFYHWAPIFLLFLYYPLRTLKLPIKSWENVIFYLFLIECVVELIQNLFPSLLLFNMTSGNWKFLNENRVRVYGNAILYIGNLFCFNKALLENYGTKKWLYWIMYFVSLMFMLLGGYRIVMLSNIVASLILFIRIRGLGIRYYIISGIIAIILGGVSTLSVVQDRISEIEERSVNQNFNNENYARMITLNYYLNDYFINPVELFLGSGLVQRQVKEDTNDVFTNKKYESKYSSDVSMMSARFHIYPIDWGLLGFSWEAGIPATLILVIIAIIFICTKLDNRYLYISAWGMFILLFSITNGRYYSHHNLIYSAILLVLCDKIYQLKKVRKIKER